MLLLGWEASYCTITFYSGDWCSTRSKCEACDGWGMQHAIDELQNDTDISVRKPERKGSGGAPKRTSDNIKTDLFVHVDGVRLCLSTATTDEPVVRPPDDI
jgi:hypothetical protein